MTRGVVVQGFDDPIERDVRGPWWFAALVSLLVTTLSTVPLWLF